MKVLITGAGGFIGSHLTDRLLRDGHNVVAIDNFSTGRHKNLTPHPNLTVVQTSILDPIEELFHGIDVVFHLAALTKIQESIAKVEEYNKTNVDGTVKIFTHAKDNKVKRVVFVSSSSVYGDNVVPTPEDVILNPMCPYALQKQIGEQYAKLFETLYGLEINCVRPFNVFGTRQLPGSTYSAAVPKFIDSFIKDTRPWITGDGKQTRDFIYIDDMVDLLVLLSQCETYGETFNAGSGQETSVNDLLKTICEIMDKPFTPDYIEKVFEPSRVLADMLKVKQVLNWTPKVSLRDGLERTVYGTLNNNS